MNRKLFFAKGIVLTIPLKNKLRHVKNLFTLLFLFSFGFIFGQYQKMDYKFETLLNENKSTSRTKEKLNILAKNLQVDQQLVVTAKGA